VTLAVGDRLVKVDKATGRATTPEAESYVELVVVDASPAFEDLGATRVGPPGEGADPRAIVGNAVQFLKVRQARPPTAVGPDIVSAPEAAEGTGAEPEVGAGDQPPTAASEEVAGAAQAAETVEGPTAEPRAMDL
jgi:hypothetical protein